MCVCVWGGGGVGTTVMQGHVYDSSGRIRGASSVKVCGGGGGGSRVSGGGGVW